jgi:hypothetical protein
LRKVCHAGDKHPFQVGCRVNRSDEILFLTATIMKDFSSHPRAALITRWSELSFDRFLWLFRNTLRTLAPRRIVAETRAELTLAVGVIMNNCFARDCSCRRTTTKRICIGRRPNVQPLTT